MPTSSSNVLAFTARLRERRCGAALVSQDRLEAVLASPVGLVFVLRADGLALKPLVARIHAADKLVAVHLDLVDGLRPDRAGVRWLARSGVDAIISSHGQLMPAVQHEGLVAIHRLLLVRNELLDAALAAVVKSGADIVELLPGVILPEVRPLMPPLRVPLLAGGFIRTEAVARAVLAAGAAGVTTSTENLWWAEFR
ncbi:MAG: glycerol-3-phosphate responsive antiterminator [Candidatus Limnocylindrales bacterium]